MASLQCPSCKSPLAIASGDASTCECDACGKTVLAYKCECGYRSVTTTETTAWSCPNCKEWHIGFAMREGAVLRWCPPKNTPVIVSPDDKWFRCPHCQQTHTIPGWGEFKCAATGKAVFSERGVKKVQCLHCEEKHKPFWWFSDEIRNVAYMGGHREVIFHKNVASLVADPGGLHLKGVVHEIVNIPWPQITDVAVDGAASLGSRLTAERMATLGVLPLAAPKQKSNIESYVTITLASGDTPVFHIEGTPESKVRAVISNAQQRMAAWPKPSLLVKTFSSTPTSFDEVIADAVAAAPKAKRSPVARTQAPVVHSSSSMTDELAKLVRFHESGALSDEEFTAAKAKLLGL